MSKRLINKHSYFAQKEMSCFASNFLLWRKFSVVTVFPRGVMLGFQDQGFHLTLR